jgi:REP element-mobilizing transposase RayT
MPDHAHVLVTGETPEASLSDLVRLWKQVTGYRWHARQGQRLWQPGYFERVLRNDEPSLSVARYIIENPVRAGLARSAASYPLAGSSCYSVDEIIDAVQMDFAYRWRR